MRFSIVKSWPSASAVNSEWAARERAVAILDLVLRTLVHLDFMAPGGTSIDNVYLPTMLPDMAAAGPCS